MDKKDWADSVIRHQTEFIPLVFRWSPNNLESFKTAIKLHDANRLYHILSQVWWNAPDQPWIRDIPGWLNMCDLLSDYLPGGGNTNE